MEDTLRGTIFQLQVTSAKVLILVLMEDTLREPYLSWEILEEGS